MLVALAATLLVPTAHAADYYVKNGGNDAADGLSPATAWATLPRRRQVAPGDTVHVADGNYQGFDLTRSGTAGDRRSRSSPTGSAAQITADNGATPDGINVEDAAYVVIDGFIVEQPHARRHPRRRLATTSRSATARAGNNGRWGIFTGFVDDLTIENNETYGSCSSTASTCPTAATGR